MGGMIAQVLAPNHPEHARSLVSIMSSTGAHNAGWTAPSTLRLVFRPAATDPEAAADRAALVWRHIASHGFPLDEEAVRDRARRSFDRDPRGAAGTVRQM